MVLSSRALRDGEVFQVRIDKMVDKWAGSIEIGVTTHNPAYLQLPSTMTNLRSGELPRARLGWGPRAEPIPAAWSLFFSPFLLVTLVMFHPVAKKVMGAEPVAALGTAIFLSHREQSQISGKTGWAVTLGEFFYIRSSPAFPLMSSVSLCPLRDLDDDWEWGDAQWNNHLG